MSVEERLRVVAAETRALQLLQCLRDAVAGDPHWRSRAVTVLKLIDAGEVQMPRERPWHA